MSVKFNVVERGNPSNPAAPKKFYPSPVSTDRVEMRGVVNRVAEMSTISTPDTMAAVESLLKVIPGYISEGRIVDLGDFGSFWLRLKSSGSDTEDQVSAENVKNVLVLFRPGPEFERILDDIKFRKV